MQMSLSREHPTSQLYLSTILKVTSHIPRPSVHVTHSHVDIAHLPGKGSGPRGVSDSPGATQPASGMSDSAHTVWLQSPRVCITIVLTITLLTEPWPVEWHLHRAGCLLWKLVLPGYQQPYLEAVGGQQKPPAIPWGLFPALGFYL